MTTIIPYYCDDYPEEPFESPAPAKNNQVKDEKHAGKRPEKNRLQIPAENQRQLDGKESKAGDSDLVDVD